MDIFQTFATDEALETEGKWFPLSKTASVLVARTGNSRYADVLRESMKDNPLEGLGEKEANAVAETVLLEVMAETVLLGWKGLQYKGKDVPYSKEMARTMLGIKDFRRKISALADNFEAFKVKAEVEQGND